MTVFGNTSKDTMAVTTSVNNIAGLLDNQESNTANSNAILSEDNNSPNVSISDPNWSTNCINDNNSNNNNNNAIINNANVTQTEETFSNPDDTLEPIDRLEKYSISDIIFHRSVNLTYNCFYVITNICSKLMFKCILLLFLP